ACELFALVAQLVLDRAGVASTPKDESVRLKGLEQAQRDLRVEVSCSSQTFGIPFATEHRHEKISLGRDTKRREGPHRGAQFVQVGRAHPSSSSGGAN